MISLNPTEKKGPLVSICIPTYNQAQFIQETLQSCLMQTYSPVEIVVLDDGSSDDTPQIVERLANENVCIRFVRNSRNLGVEASWNKALAEAHGEFVKLLCGDDLLEPTCIERQLHALLSCPDLALVSCSRKIIDSKSRILRSKKRCMFLQAVTFSEGFRELIRSGTNVIGEPACVLFRKGPEYFDGELPYMIDLDFWLKLWARGSILVLEETLASFRVHRDSLTSSIGVRHFQEFHRFVQKVRRANPGLLRIDDYWVGSLKALVRGWMRNILILIYGS